MYYFYLSIVETVLYYSFQVYNIVNPQVYMLCQLTTTVATVCHYPAQLQYH